MKSVLSLFALAFAAAFAGLRYFVPSRDMPQPPVQTPTATAPPPPAEFFSFLDNRPVALPLGWRPEDQQRPFVMSEWHLSHHQLVLGTTGSGKSRYCELQCKFLIDSLRGFCFIDPDGDTAENLLAYAIKKSEEEGTDAIIKQIVYIELNFATVFGCDPFAPPDFSDVPPELQENAYRQWLSVKVDQFSLIIQSKQGDGDFSGMARLQRVLRTVLFAIGASIDHTGRHLPLSEIFALLDCDHPRHNDVYAIVRDHLSGDIQAEFERWRRADRRQRLLETESTLNRLTSILTPLVLALFTEPARRINFRDLIDHRMIVLVNLRQSIFLSADQQQAVGSLFLQEIWSACKVKDRKDRNVVPYYLFVDESHIYMQTAGNVLLEILERGRKYKLSLTLIGQFLGQFTTEKVDMIPAVLNLCRSVACFLHSDSADLKIWKEFFGYPNLDFTELFQVMDRPDGNEFIKLRDYARNYTCGVNWTSSVSEEQSQSTSTTHTQAVGNVQGTSVANATQKSTTKNSSTSGGEGKQKDAHGHETGGSASENKTEGTGTAEGTNVVHAETSSRSVTDSVGTTVGSSVGHGKSEGTGGSLGSGITESEKTAIIPKTREEWHPTGRLRHAIEDQFHKMAQIISTLQNRQAVVRLLGETRTFRMDVGDCPDVFTDPVEMARAIEAFKEKIFKHHPFYFVPDLSPSAQKHRLEAWLEEAGLAGEGEPAYEERPCPNDHRNGTPNGKKPDNPIDE